MSTTQSVDLSGVMTLRNIADAHAELLQAFAPGTDVVLDLSAVEEADLTFVQLILSAQQSAVAQQLGFTLSAPAPEPVMQVLVRGGFIDPESDARRDFWLAN
jgi:anti-anti-sigma regulatory factor